MRTGTIRLLFSGWILLCAYLTGFTQVSPNASELVNHAMVTYNFDRVFSGKEVRKVGLDKNGFLWFTIPPSTIMRWNGRESKVVDRLANGQPIPPEYISFPQSDIKGRPVWCNPSQRNQWMQVDDDGKLRLYEADSTKNAEMAWSFLGNAALWIVPPTWLKINQSRQKFQRGLIDEWRFRYRFFIDSSRLYVFDTAHVFYYSDTAVRVLPGRIGWQLATGCLVGKYWLSIQDHHYQLFDQNRLVDAGELPPALRASNPGSPSLIWDAQFLGDSTIAGFNKQVVRFSVRDGKLQVRTMVELPSTQTYTSVFWHAAAEKLLVIPSRGGFVVYEPKLFQRLPQHASSELLCYSVAPALNERIITNLDFRRAVEWQDPERFSFAEQSAILWNSTRKEYYYAHHNFFYVLDQQMRIRKKMRISGGLTYSMHLTDSALYFHSGDLYVYRFRQEALERILQEGGSGMDIVFFIHPATSNKLFVAKGTYVGEFDVTTKRWTRLHVDSLLHIRSLRWDETHKRLWVTTNGYGTYLLDPSQPNQKALRLPSSVYPAVQFAHYVLRDSDGDYWLPTNRGLYLLPAEQLAQWLSGKQSNLAMRYFGKPQGLENEEFNGGFSSSGFIRGDSLFLASMEGVVTANFKSLKARRDEVRRQVVLDQILLNDDVLSVQGLLSINPNYRKLVIAVDYSYIEHPSAEMHYRIRGGLDTTWYTVPANGEIRLPNFRPGHYTFEVTSTDEPGDQYLLEVPIVIQQYWYLRWWAWVIYIVTIASLTYLVLRWWFARRELETITRQSNFRKQLLSWVGHDLRSPVVSHRTMTHMLTEAVDQENWGAVKQMSQFLYSSSHAMELLIQNLVQWGKSDLGELAWKPEKVHVSPMLDSLKALYRFHAETNGIEVEFPAVSHATLVTDSNLLQLLLRNLIDNAIKNANRGTAVRVGMQQNQDSISFSIENKASQINAELLKRIDDWFSMPSHRVNDDAIAGFGLGMVAIRTALHRLNGRATVQWRNDTVRFQITIPSVDMPSTTLG